MRMLDQSIARDMGVDIAELLQGSGLRSRRIGRRVATPGLWLDWHPVDPKGRRRRWRGLAPTVQRAKLMDLSVTGARVVVADEVPIGVGSIVTFGLGGDTGTCMVRRAELSGLGEAAYGIEFIWLDPELAKKVHHLVAVNRRSVDEQWALDCARTRDA